MSRESSDHNGKKQSGGPYVCNFFCSLESMGHNWIARSSKLHAVQEATARKSARRRKNAIRASHPSQKRRELEVVDQQVSEFEDLFPLNPHGHDDVATTAGDCYQLGWS